MATIKYKYIGKHVPGLIKRLVYELLPPKAHTFILKRWGVSLIKYKNYATGEVSYVWERIVKDE